MHDQVRLQVPATPEFVRVVRLTATGLASRLGFTYDEVEDLRLAIDELCHAVVGSKGVDGDLVLDYAVSGGALEISGATTGANGRAPALSDFSEQILQALVDDYAVGSEDGRPSFRLRKSRTEV